MVAGLVTNGLAVGLCTIGIAFGWVHGCASRDIQPCGVLPDPDACPIGRGGTCDDRTCSALYNCVEGNWTLERTCEGVGGGGAGGAGAGGGPACVEITIDRTGEVPGGCSPPLQEPDCPAAAAELCRPCETLCADFFLCRGDGWNVVAFCDPEGNLVVEP